MVFALLLLEKKSIRHSFFFKKIIKLPKYYMISLPDSDKNDITFHRIMEMPQFFSVNMHNTIIIKKITKMSSTMVKEFHYILGNFKDFQIVFLQLMELAPLKQFCRNSALKKLPPVKHKEEFGDLFEENNIYKMKSKYIYIQ